jgi:RimJ/RimL family protein N-acetyltransferase
MPLPDVEGAMRSFQQALEAGEIQLQPGALDSQIYVHMDRPNGEPRLTYVRLDGITVTAMVQFILCDPLEGEPCFSVGWAVPPSYRGKGRSGEAFLAAVRELRNGFAPQGMTAFWIEGVVGAENKASQRVAEKVISAPIATAMDSHADVPIVQYLRRIEANTVV